MAGRTVIGTKPIPKPSQSRPDSESSQRQRHHDIRQSGLNRRRSAMAEDARPKIELVANSEDKPEAASIFDDLAALRKKSKLTVVRKTVLVNVSVDRPP